MKMLNQTPFVMSLNIGNTFNIVLKDFADDFLFVVGGSCQEDLVTLCKVFFGAPAVPCILVHASNPLQRIGRYPRCDTPDQAG